MDQWDDLNLIEPPRLAVTGKDGGEIIFGAIEEDRTSPF